ncbi:MAG: Hsp20/alpha crystallin family protein [Planctomycetes bacterium]|nr:Hsp20/alpha crystallin family protein [Planctomycetota bacterium]
MGKELIKWPQMPSFTSLRDEMNQLFDDFFKKRPFFETAWSPELDVSETNDNVIVKAEVPGLDPKDIDISISGDTLTLKGEKKEEKHENDRYYHRIERRYGSFMRSVTLPESVDSEKVKAECKNGILEITLPKVEKAKPKKITVKVE